MQWFKNFVNMVLDQMTRLEEEQVYVTPTIPLTQFEMVQELHHTVSHPVRTVPTIPSLDEQELMVGLIKEELKEFEEALARGDIVEVVDALGDMAVVVNGAGMRCGVNMDHLAPVIHESNMSKFCETEHDAKLSQAKYTAEGVETHIEKTDNNLYVIKRRDGKFLKGINFYTPDIKGYLASKGLFVAD